MAVSNSLEALVVRSTFIFTGTLERPESSAVRVLAARPQLAVVRFETALRIDPMLGNLSGKPITVLLAAASVVRAGERLVFFAESWVHAEEIAVREFGHLADEPEIVNQVKTIVNDLPLIHLRERVAGATLIVSGAVLRVERASDIREPITEHAPEWMRAYIAIEDVLKGSPPSDQRKELMLYFPASHDRAWRDWPKLKKGQTGIFLIHVLPRPPLRLPAGALVLPDPADVQSERRLSAIRKLLGDSAPN